MVVVARVTENRVNGKNVINSEMTSMTTARSDVSRNAVGGRVVPCPILNRENGIDSERRSVTAVRSDVTRNGWVGRGAPSPIPPLNNFLIHTWRSQTNTTTSAVSDVMQFLLIRMEKDAQQQRKEHEEANKKVKT